MAPQWRRWLNYAKAKLDTSIAESEADLDRREAELQARAAGRPWLADDSAAPTLEETRARIEYEVREAERRAGGSNSGRKPADGGAGHPDPASAPAGAPGEAASPGSPGSERPGRATGPTTSDAVPGSEASIDFEAQQREAEKRVAAIRAELGLDADPPGPSQDPPPDSGPDPSPRS